MKKVEKLVTKVSCFFDNLAGLGIVLAMLLVVVNVPLRAINRPIQGVYEYAGFIMAVIIAFALAYCAVQNGHIAIEFLIEKLPVKLQKIINTFFGTILFFFIVFAGIQMIDYARKSALSGEVSPTAHIPIYPFIFMVAIGLFALSLVEFIKLIKGVMGKWNRQ